MTQLELDTVLELHTKWLLELPDGVQANLNGVNLIAANLSCANLSRANLSGANLSRANLNRVSLVAANLSGASLVGTSLYRANLNRANLDRANLNGASLVGASLNGASLVDTNLIGANLNGVKFDFKIYSFCLGKHSAVITKEYVQIGCHKYSLDYWLSNIEEIGNYESYTAEQIVEYKDTLIFFNSMINKRA